jgi:molecular chaperone GrpE (heat shock protein)
MPKTKSQPQQKPTTTEKSLQQIRQAKAEIDAATQEYQQEYLKVQEEIQMYKKALIDQQKALVA